MAHILRFTGPQSDFSIQEASVERLRALDPERVFAHAVGTPARVDCDTDYLHGKGICYLMLSNGQEVDVLCLSCAVTAVETCLLMDPDRYLVLAVAW
jgi:hypothetical protein